MRKVSLFKRMDDLNLLIGCYLLVLKYTARDLISGVQSNFSCHWELVSFFYCTSTVTLTRVQCIFCQ